MKTNPLKEGVLARGSTGIGTVTRGMVRDRAVELAAISAHPGQQPSKSDWERAKRELTGGPEADANETTLESAPESKRWDPVPGSEGRKTPDAPSEDEDDEGRSDNQRLVEAGVSEAAHDQMLKANRAVGKKGTGRNPEGPK